MSKIIGGGMLAIVYCATLAWFCTLWGTKLTFTVAGGMLIVCLWVGIAAWLLGRG